MKTKTMRMVFLMIIIFVAAFAAIDTTYATDSTAPVINSLSIQNADAIDGQGEMTVEMDITEDGGYMSSGVLESSNVDLAKEFTDMITTQRGFQANSKVITTSDEMLQVLRGLKR